MERPSGQFSSPHEEIAFLRNQIAEKERALLERNPEMDKSDVETLGKQELKEYVSFTPQSVLAREQVPSDEEEVSAKLQIEEAKNPVEQVLEMAFAEGVHKALTALEAQKNPYLTDEVHRRLIEEIVAGTKVQGLKEGVPPWQVLHMSLFEVTMPSQGEGGATEHSLTELFSVMQQFFAGMRAIGTLSKAHYVLELAVADNSDDIVVYVAVPNQHTNLFEKQLLSLFPGAQLTLQLHDYNIFVDNGEHAMAVASLKKHPIYPIRHNEQFQSDPLLVLLNAFSKIERHGGGASVQVIVKPESGNHLEVYKRIMDRIEVGMKPSDSIAKSTIGGDMMLAMKDMFASSHKKSDPLDKTVDTDALQLFRTKIAQPVVETNIRLVVSGKTKTITNQVMSEIQASLNQFHDVQGNQFTFENLKGPKLQQGIREFSFRQFNKKHVLPLSEIELATFFHFPEINFGATPQFKQSFAKTAAAPNDIPAEGTHIGTNRHRGVEKEIFVTEKDRMRHFYIIGQTGTGKSVFMKNLIIQDIQAGAGVCMIDPHGTDIQDVLAAVPPEREQDVIYFDPSNLDRVLGLNMLEYDIRKPEQKTFVVNELFSIFQKLYGDNPESMGPMFEQYFRNATLLVMEDPMSGNTLMDIGRVMADASYRRMKLQKATNPVVVQFWREIASKAGGEASLENIVPYIVSKFDVFTANDYMRPIIGQQKSSFNFREVMDTRKIFLVNLSKGLLGDINANLLGMVLVGKILMAALSRVDTPSMNFPPFYLHIDEFQNISTPSISAILSEARKYKLGLTMAHQFIAQLDEGIKDAVFGNVGSMAVFRVGPEDAQYLEHQFGPTFTANEIMNIPNFQAYARVLANGVPTQPFSFMAPPPPEVDPSRVPDLMEKSFNLYARDRAEIEEEIQLRYQKPKPVMPTLHTPQPGA